jgi:thiol-disulfide isomerase/thioredoxin
MHRWLAVLVFTTLTLLTIQAGDEPTRAERLKAIQEEFKIADQDFWDAVKANKIPSNQDDEYPVWYELAKKYIKLTRDLIEADPTDKVAFEAIGFILRRLREPGTNLHLYRLLEKHHLDNENVRDLLHYAPIDFQKVVSEKAAYTKVRLWAKYHVAESLYASNQGQEAEPYLLALSTDKEAQQLGGYNRGHLSDSATRLLFEIQRLNIGQEIPEINGKDLDEKPMKLSEYRGKVTLVVFWATWCGPCMAMVKHERDLVKQCEGKPFAIVGINGDSMRSKDDKYTMTDGVTGKIVDDTELVKSAVEKSQMTWRSFRNGENPISVDWNIRSWPTIYLLDERGIIRGKWKGDPGKKELDAAIEMLMKAIEKK